MAIFKDCADRHRELLNEYLALPVLCHLCSFAGVALIQASAVGAFFAAPQLFRSIANRAAIRANRAIRPANALQGLASFFLGEDRDLIERQHVASPSRFCC